MRKPILIISIATLLAVPTVKAQLVIQKSGRVVAGANASYGTTHDPEGKLTLSVLGKNHYNAGAKLGFGDFGRKEYGGWNVFIGEYGDHDSDILWLHGKKGIRLTTGIDQTVMEWGSDGKGMPRLTINDGLRVERLCVSADDNHKQSVKKITKALPRLMQLKGVTYTYHPLPLAGKAGKGGSDTLGDPTPKELAAMQEASYLRSLREKGDVRYGLMTAELAKLFPEVVEYDTLGNQYINYMELIPVVVTAISELCEAMERSGIYLKMDEGGRLMGMQQPDSVGAPSGLKGLGAGAGSRPTLAMQAELYQNSPNPFSSTTVIEYYVPDEATSAELFVFNLNGELLQTYPVEPLGHGAVTINGSTLSAGMYVYTLVVDNQIADTKRMILTK